MNADLLLRFSSSSSASRRLRTAFARAAICFCFLSLASSAAELKWTHFTIANPLPGTTGGTAGIPLADLDGDGDLDCALSRAENGDVHGFWWYERKSDSVWVQHLINDSTNIMQGLGAAALDVDNDGWTDLVFDQAWFKNPGTLRENPDCPWEAHDYEHCSHEVHDILGADVNGEEVLAGQEDHVALSGIDRWWAGTHLQGRAVWRYDRGDRRLVAPGAAAE